MLLRHEGPKLLMRRRGLDSLLLLEIFGRSRCCRNGWPNRVVSCLGYRVHRHLLRRRQESRLFSNSSLRHNVRACTYLGVSRLWHRRPILFSPTQSNFGGRPASGACSLRIQCSRYCQILYSQLESRKE